MFGIFLFSTRKKGKPIFNYRKFVFPTSRTKKNKKKRKIYGTEGPIHIWRATKHNFYLRKFIFFVEKRTENIVFITGNSYFQNEMENLDFIARNFCFLSEKNGKPNVYCLIFYSLPNKKQKIFVFIVGSSYLRRQRLKKHENTTKYTAQQDPSIQGESHTLIFITGCFLFFVGKTENPNSLYWLVFWSK